MNTLQQATLFLFFLLCTATTTTSAASLRGGRHQATSDCLQIRGTLHVNGQWHALGTHKGFPYYYNEHQDLYLYMARPIADSPKLYYTIHTDLSDDTTVMGYCTQEFMDIFDCGARWMSKDDATTTTFGNLERNARFEACPASDPVVA